MAGTNIALRAFGEKLAAGMSDGLMMPLHWYKRTARNPLFKVKQKAAIATLAAGGAAYGFGKLTDAPEAKPVAAGGGPRAY